MHRDDCRKETYQYVQTVLAYNCMPTLLKMKPSTILNVQKHSCGKEDVFFELFRHEIEQFNCQYNIILETETSYIILVYEEKMLTAQLTDEECSCVLKSFGYDLGKNVLRDALFHLKKRYRTYMEEREEFPDELGIFFGYPIEDVVAYIANNGKNYKRCGFWKVYCNVECAERTFCAFRQAREAAVQTLSEGMSLIEVKRNYQSA